MMIPRVVLSLILLTGLVTPALAADLVGRAVDKESGEPVEFVIVSLRTAEGKALSTTMTDEKGEFRFKGVRGGTVELDFSRIGYVSTRMDGIELEPEGFTEVQVELQAETVIMAPIVVSASRTREIAMRAPRSTSMVDSTIAEAIQLTPADVLRTEPQVDFRQKGLLQTTYNLRNAAGSWSVATLILQDYRYTGLPAFKANLSYLLAAGMQDIERIEIARGPSSALYGPDGRSGVVHLITRSPLDKQGTTLAIAGGERSVFQSSFRHAGIFSDRVGFKVSAEYFRGEDWKWNHPNAGRDIERAAGEARLDWRPSNQTSLILSGGLANAFELVDQSPGSLFQADNLRYGYAQTRLHHNRWLVNAMYNANYTDSSVNLLSGLPLIEQSQMLAGQIQYGNTFQVGSRLLDLTYGLDHRTTTPRTGRTIHGRFEDNDTITEIGTYLHGKALVSSHFDLTGALRADYHDRMNNVALSPRVGLVYSPKPEHAFRTTFDRSFESLSAALLFQDIVIGGAEPYEIRLFGSPKSGFTYRFDCDGPCMRSAFVPGGLGQYGEADATRAWAAIQQQIPALASIPAPSSNEVATTFKRLEFGRGFLPVTPNDIQDIEQAKRGFIDTFEAGYKGILAKRLKVGADVFVFRDVNLSRQLTVSTNVYFDETTLRQYLIDEGMSSAGADSAVAEVADLPVGTINPEQVGASSDLYRALSSVDETSPWFWGAALNAEFMVSRQFKLAANYMWRDGEPRNWAIGRLHFDHSESGVSSYFQVRYRGTQTIDRALIWNGRVDSWVISDFNLRYRPRWAPRMELSFTVNNVFDDKHQQVPGAPEIGRLALARLRVDL